MKHLPLLQFIVEHSFTERDIHRFGLWELAEEFAVEVIYVSDGALRKSDLIDHGLMVHTAATPSDIESIIRRSRPSIIVSNLGAGNKRASAFRAGRLVGSILVEFQLGLTPGDLQVARTLTRKIRRRILQARSGLELIRSFLRRISRRSDFHVSPDLKIVCGRRARELAEASGITVIKAHSHDFNLLLRVSNLSTKSHSSVPFAVYLDQDMGFHVDYKIDRLRVPIKPDEFYPSLLRYFRDFTEATGLEVIICPHPRCDVSQLPSRFPGLEISSLPTWDAVRNSSCVLSHNSISLSFAVAWRKPAILLADRRLISSWEGQFVTSLADSLGAPIDMIDLDLKSFGMPLNINEARYRDYTENYLSEIPNDTRTTWEIARRFMIQELLTRSTRNQSA